MGVLSNVLSQIGRFVGNMFELLAYAVAALIYAAIWAVGAVIEIAADILKWINDGLESLMDSGATEVNAVQGQALAEFIKQNQATGKYTEVTLEQLNAMNNSVIILAVQNDGIVIDEQMIRSTGGLSENAKNQFQGQPVLKIKIPVIR